MATTSSPRRSRSKKESADRDARSRAKEDGKPDPASAQKRTTHEADGAPGTLHQVVDKAKRPVLVGGAVAAIAGGVAVARNGRRSKGFSLPSVGRKKRRGLHMPHISMPHPSMPHLPHKPDGETTTEALRASAKALGTAAVEVGKAGYRVGELASEVRRVREQTAHKGD